MQADTSEELPRNKQNPADVAFAVIDSLHKLYMSIFEGAPEEEFFEKWCDPLWEQDEITGEDWQNWFNNKCNSQQAEDVAKTGLLQAVIMALLFSFDAIKAYKAIGSRKGQKKYAWTFVSDAQYWLGITCGSFSIKKHSSPSANAKKAAMARHKENHDMRSQVIDYYKNNLEKFKSKDAAAEEIAGNLVPVKFRTVRGWIAEYHKKQSARTLQPMQAE